VVCCIERMDSHSTQGHLWPSVSLLYVNIKLEDVA